MLAYYLSYQLRLLWASSIGEKALLAVAEITKEAVPDLPTEGLKPEQKLLAEAKAKKYVKSDGKPYSFLDTWELVKNTFIKTVCDSLNQVDFVTFSSHGAVISFDHELIKQQIHEDKDVALQLGFEMWDSLYDQSLNPFYRKEGTKEGRKEGRKEGLSMNEFFVSSLVLF